MSVEEEEFKKFKKVLLSGIYELAVLLVISKSPRPSYGYLIMKNLEKASSGKFRPTVSTLYPILKKLEKKGFLRSFWGESSQGPPRKYYVITESGRKFLELALKEMDEIYQFLSKLR